MSMSLTRPGKVTSRSSAILRRSFSPITSPVECHAIRRQSPSIIVRVGGVDDAELCRRAASNEKAESGDVGFRLEMTGAWSIAAWGDARIVSVDRLQYGL